MSEPKEGASAGTGELDRHQMMSALFASLVVNQVRMALMFLGRTPHPETGEAVKDLEAARLFIDQLEMLEAKTKGNLEPQERKLLRDHLTSLHMAFVDATSESPSSAAPQTTAAPEGEAKSEKGSPAEASGESVSEKGSGSTIAEESDSRKKFSKKY
jgi:hypothetical protein